MSGDIAALGSQAIALYEQGRVADALALAWQTAAAHPNSALAQYTYASLLRECGRDREALAVVEQALRLSPHDPDALVLRGDLRCGLVGAHAGEADYRQALRLHPGHPRAVHNLAVSRLRPGTLTAAVRGLLDAGRLDPALIPVALANITRAVTGVLRWATASVVLLGAALIAVGALHDAGASTGPARALTVLVTLPPAAAIVWTVRTVPAPTLPIVLRGARLLAVRLLFAGSAVIAGLLAAAGAAGFAGVAGPALLVGVVGLTVLGWFTGA